MTIENFQFLKPYLSFLKKQNNIQNKTKQNKTKNKQNKTKNQYFRPAPISAQDIPTPKKLSAPPPPTVSVSS